MKINVEIDCTPLEARAFLGLPDVQPMQEKLMAEMQERLTANIRAMDPAEMMRLWFAPGLKGLDEVYAAFARMSGTKQD